MIRRRHHSIRAALAALGGGLLGMIAFAAPAAANVVVSPAEAVQGGSVRVTLRLPSERAPAFLAKVEVHLPVTTPVAEVYPLSVPDWAPGLTTRQLAEPLPLIHGTQTTEVVSVVTWTRVVGPPADPAQPVELSLSMGPMPKADQLAMTVVQTYSDGVVVRWGEPAPDGAASAGAAVPGPVASRPAAVLNLVPPAQRPGEDPANSGPAAGQGSAGAHPPARTADRSPVAVLLAAVAVVVLVLAGLFFAYPRRSRSAAGSPEGTFLGRATDDRGAADRGGVGRDAVDRGLARRKASASR